MAILLKDVTIAYRLRSRYGQEGTCRAYGPNGWSVSQSPIGSGPDMDLLSAWAEGNITDD